jgi:hypothetical protein
MHASTPLIHLLFEEKDFAVLLRVLSVVFLIDDWCGSLFCESTETNGSRFRSFRFPFSGQKSGTGFMVPQSAIRIPQSKRWGPIGPWAMVVRICDHPRNLARSFSKRKSTTHRGRRVGRRRSKIQVSGPPLLTKTSERPHCSDRRKEFYNDFWPPWIRQ